MPVCQHCKHTRSSNWCQGSKSKLPYKTLLARQVRYTIWKTDIVYNMDHRCASDIGNLFLKFFKAKRIIFTMVTYFLRWTLLKFFSSIPDEQSQQKVRQLDRITCAVINTSNEVKSPLLWEFWIYNFLWEFYKESLVGSIVNIRNECLFLGSWGMNRNAEQTNRPRTTSRFTLFVCPALQFIPHEPRKKTLIPYIYNASNQGLFITLNNKNVT